MICPTTAQQKGIAYAPIPFAVVSFLSSSYVIYHLLFQKRKKLERLYHRLVLAMNIAQLPLSFTFAWSTMMVPKGTPHYAGSMGTVNTCTAGGFLKMMFSMTVATYYASLVLQAFLGVRNNFKEIKYRWIEVPVHIFAYCTPCAFAIIIAAAERFNPYGSGCFISKAPLGCESNPDVECERGKDLNKYFEYLVGASHLCLYFVYPPLVILAIHCWMKKAQTQRTSRNSGMSIIREEARKEMMKSVYRQISVYLFSFWFTWIFSVIQLFHYFFTREVAYNLVILANCIFALQGFVFVVVYFTLQKMGRGHRVDYFPNETLSLDRSEARLTVHDIRLSVQRKAEDGSQEHASNEAGSFNFNIFDGEPDPDSPWARYFDQGDHSDNEDAPEKLPPKEEIELTDGENASG